MKIIDEIKQVAQRRLDTQAAQAKTAGQIDKPKRYGHDARVQFAQERLQQLNSATKEKTAQAQAKIQQGVTQGVQRVQSQAERASSLPLMTALKALASVPLNSRTIAYAPKGYRHEPIHYAGGRATAENDTAVIIIHGFTGSPHSMYPIADYLRERRYPVEMPLLTGHGSDTAALADSTYREWLGSVELSYRRLTKLGFKVILVGMSMGGALAINIAARFKVEGLVLINPFLVDVNPMMAAARWLAPLLPSLASIGSDISIPGVDEGSYGRTPTAAIYQLHLLGKETRSLVHRVNVPVLYLRSRNDHVVSDSSHEFFMEHCSSPVEFRWLPNSYHVATLDRDAAFVLAETGSFINGLVRGSRTVQ